MAIHSRPESHFFYVCGCWSNCTQIHSVWNGSNSCATCNGLQTSQSQCRKVDLTKEECFIHNPSQMKENHMPCLPSLNSNKFLLNIRALLPLYSSHALGISYLSISPSLNSPDTSIQYLLLSLTILEKSKNSKVFLCCMEISIKMWKKQSNKTIMHIKKLSGELPHPPSWMGLYLKK